MLNSKGERELAYLVRIDNVYKHPNADRLDVCTVGGWNIVTGLNEFKPHDLAIYFEIDSQLPEVEPFINMEFLKSKHYKIKTQKIRGIYSQGMLIRPQDLGWYTLCSKTDDIDNTDTCIIYDANDNSHSLTDDTKFVTQLIGVTYAVAEDNKRKAKSPDKFSAVCSRYSNFFKKPLIRKLTKYKFFRKLVVFLLGHKIKVRNYPNWIVKTDEERVQNMSWILNQKGPWIVTEKIDGTSATYSIRRTKNPFNKYDFYICSRNVVLNRPGAKCYYDQDVYSQIAQRHDMQSVLIKILDDLDIEWATIQGEIFGQGVQKRDYSVTPQEDGNAIMFRVFNFVTPKDGRWGSLPAKDYLGHYGVPFVPILDDSFYLPDTVDELLEQATGMSVIDNKPREGLVIRSRDGKQSFKAVSNEFLMKYHGKD